MIKTLIADDESIIRQGLETFCTLDSEIEVISTACNGREALELTLKFQPDVVLMDVLMPEMDGIEATTIIKKELPATRVLMLTGLINRETLNRSLKARADGFILKNIDQDELCHTIKAATTGLFVTSPEVVLFLTNPVKSGSILNNLTQREVEVLKFLAGGKANKEIAYALGLSEGTVKTHISIILSKIGMQSRTQAAIYANENGLI
jgi:DNA-binding NarL/FixJ family response regulator